MGVKTVRSLVIRPNAHLPGRVSPSVYWRKSNSDMCNRGVCDSDGVVTDVIQAKDDSFPVLSPSPW